MSTLTKSGSLRNLSRRNKIIGIAILVLLVLLIVSIPGDRNVLLARQERIEAAEVAYNLALPTVSPALENIKAYLDASGLDLSANRSYTGLPTMITKFNSATTEVGQFQEVVTFRKSVHALMEGTNVVPELDTDEFKTLVADMDTTLSVAIIALIELNTATDEYNSYHNWISATVAGALFSLPQSYEDPIPTKSPLNRTLLQQ